MQRARGRRARRQNERRQGGQVRVHRVDLPLETVDLRRLDPQRGGFVLAGVGRNAEVGPQVEQIILDAPKDGVEFRRRVAQSGAGYADRRIRFVDLPIGRHAGVVLASTLAVSEPRQAIISGPRIDPIELDHGLSVRATRER
jgi:hypothetical protein